MSSILPGFEYDIFISYRHNDNRAGWVTDFVQQLNKELAATLKEPVSIYFDENPGDGLLETDLVDDSLKDKLKCLILIPILSQTYCDPKSFAWQSEFLPFKKLASEDPIGLKVKLSSGNTASRILPIKIHNLDAEDETVITNEIGPLRAIEFIFRSSGVNRPMMITDSRTDNSNKTYYPDQVNKVANCVKEIVLSLKGERKLSVTNKQDHSEQTPTLTFRKKAALSGAVILTLLIASYFVFNSFSPQSELLEKSIAVLPFDDLSQNHDQEYFTDGISEEIINALVKIEGLKVAGRTSSFQFKGKKLDLTEIGDKLKVALILEGSVRKSGDHLRITAQLVNAKNGYHVWSETYDHNVKDIFNAQDEVTQSIFKQLQKRLGVRGALAERKQPTQSLEAYDLYWRGHQQFLLKGEHVVKAQELLREAIRLDPNFAMAHAALAEAYAVVDLGAATANLQEAVLSARRALALDSTISSAYSVIAWTSRPTPHDLNEISEQFANFRKAIELDRQNSTARLWFGIKLFGYGLYNEAIGQLRAAVEVDPLVPINYGILGFMEYLHGEDSIGLIHLHQGTKMGWKAGNQRLAFYYMDHREWEKAEFYFNEHARNMNAPAQIDYHQLVVAVQKNNIEALRKILDPISDFKWLTSGLRPLLFYLVGDYERVVAHLGDIEAISQALRPSRVELRKLPGFRTYVEQSGLLAVWQAQGWPDVCHAVGENDFQCN